MSTSSCGFRPTTGIGYNIAYKTSDQNPNSIKVMIGDTINQKNEWSIDTETLRPKSTTGVSLQDQES